MNNDDFRTIEENDGFCDSFLGMKYQNCFYDFFVTKNDITRKKAQNFIKHSPDITPEMAKANKYEAIKIAAVILSNKELLQNWYYNLPQNDKNFLYEITRTGMFYTNYAVEKFNIKLNKRESYYSGTIIDFNSDDYPFAYFCSYSKYLIFIETKVRNALL